MYVLDSAILNYFSTSINASCRMFSGRSKTQIHMTPYHSITSTPSPAGYFDNISGRTSRHTPMSWVGMHVLQLTLCTFSFPLIMFCFGVSLTIYDRANSMPRWRNFNHFSAYLSVDFTDGTKWEHMSKVCNTTCINITRYLHMS
jgi:hypothetical protein